MKSQEFILRDVNRQESDSIVKGLFIALLYGIDGWRIMNGWTDGKPLG